MIISKQVQNAMNEQGLNFFTQGMATTVRLARGRFKGDHHVAKEKRLQFVREREGKHISWLVFPPILEIQVVDLRVRH